MADDFSADIGTTGRLSVNGFDPTTGGQYAIGQLESAGDHDWFRVWLWSGQTYVLREIDSTNIPYFGLTLSDAWIALYNSAGDLLISNDDGGTANDSYIAYVAPTSGYYFVDAGAFADLYTGTYYVTVTQAADKVGVSHAWGDGATTVDRFGDFNGDGRADLLQSFNGRAYVTTSDGETGFSGYSVWGTGATNHDQIGDLSGDGADDLLQIFNGRAYAAISVGSSFSAYAEWASSGVQANAVLADINGDGRGDLYQTDGAGHGFVALNSGTNSFLPFTEVLSGTSANDHIVNPNHGSAQRSPGTDFNGDGRADVFQTSGGTAYVAVATNAGGFVGNTFQNWGNIGASANDRFGGDFNADGRADLLQYFNGRAYVALSDGGSFAPYAQWVDGASSTDQMVDMNNDGRTDLFQVFQGRAYVALANGSGTGFSPFTVWGDGLAGDERAVDVTGDGLADLVHVNGSGVIEVHASIGVPGAYHSATESWYDYG